MLFTTLLPVLLLTLTTLSTAKSAIESETKATNAAAAPFVHAVAALDLHNATTAGPDANATEAGKEGWGSESVPEANTTEAGWGHNATDAGADVKATKALPGMNATDASWGLNATEPAPGLDAAEDMSKVSATSTQAYRPMGTGIYSLNRTHHGPTLNKTKSLNMTSSSANKTSLHSKQGKWHVLYGTGFGISMAPLPSMPAYPIQSSSANFFRRDPVITRQKRTVTTTTTSKSPKPTRFPLSKPQEKRDHDTVPSQKRAVNPMTKGRLIKWITLAYFKRQEKCDPATTTRQSRGVKPTATQMPPKATKPGFPVLWRKREADAEADPRWKQVAKRQDKRDTAFLPAPDQNKRGQQAWDWYHGRDWLKDRSAWVPSRGSLWARARKGVKYPTYMRGY